MKLYNLLNYFQKIIEPNASFFNKINSFDQNNNYKFLHIAYKNFFYPFTNKLSKTNLGCDEKLFINKEKFKFDYDFDYSTNNRYIKNFFHPLVPKELSSTIPINGNVNTCKVGTLAGKSLKIATVGNITKPKATKKNNLYNFCGTTKPFVESSDKQCINNFFSLSNCEKHFLNSLGSNFTSRRAFSTVAIAENENEKEEKKNKDDDAKNLIQAIKDGDLDKVKELINGNNQLLEIKDKDGKTPLLIAAWERKFDIVKWLIENTKANLSQKDKGGNNIYLCAAYGGNTEILNYLYSGKQNFKLNPNERNSNGMTALLCSATHGHIQTVEWLLKSGGASIYEYTKKGEYAFMIALSRGHEDLAFWIAQNYTKNVISQYDNDDSYPLHYAARYGSVRLVKLLLDNNSNVDAKTKIKKIPSSSIALEGKETALLIAATYGDLAVLKHLIQNTPCNKNARTFQERNTALLLAAKHGYIKIVKYLIEHNYANKEEKNRHGHTALILSIKEGHVDIVKFLLLEAGVNWQNAEQWFIKHMPKNEKYGTIKKIFEEFHLNLAIKKRDSSQIGKLLQSNPQLINKQNISQFLHLAVSEENAEITEIILKKATAINCDCGLLIDDKGNNALHVACEKNDHNMVKLLIQYKLPVNSLNYSSQSPLHIACQHGHIDIVNELLNNFTGNINSPDVNKNTPIAYAILNNRIDIVKRLGKEKTISYSYQDEDGNSLMHIAIQKEQEEIISELLFLRRENFNKPNKKGLYPMHLAVKIGNKNTLAELHNKNWSLTIKTSGKEGDTPLHIAVKNERQGSAEWLCDNIYSSTDLNSLNNEMKSALDYCRPKSSLNWIITKRKTQIEEQEKENALTPLDKELIPQIKNLVLQGGGVKGLAYIGALEELEDYDIELSKIDKVAGTSAGAITALLISLGYSMDELREEISNLDLNKFTDNKNSIAISDFKKFVEKLSTLNKLNILSKFFIMPGIVLSQEARELYKAFFGEGHGLFEGEEFRKWLEEKIKTKIKKITGEEIEHLTFEELHQLKEKYKGIKDVFVIGSNLSKKKAETFSYRHTPKMIIADAVRISMAIPFFFKAHKKYIKKNNERVCESADLYVDGGVMQNYPISIFDNKRTKNMQTLGLRLIPTPSTKPINSSTDNSLSGSSVYFTQLASLFLNIQERFYENDSERTVIINTRGISTTDFDLKNDDRDLLIFAGKEGVKNYMKKNNNTFKSNVNTPLHILTSLSGKSKVIVKLNTTEDILRLFLASSDKEIESLRKLNIDINIKSTCKNTEGMTALHLAALQGREDAVRRLIECGANPYAQDSANRYPIDLAIKSRFGKKGYLSVIIPILEENCFACSDKKAVSNFLEAEYKRANQDYNLTKAKKLEKEREKIYKLLSAFQFHHKIKSSIIISTSDTVAKNNVLQPEYNPNDMAKWSSKKAFMIKKIDDEINKLNNKYQSSFSQYSIFSPVSRGYAHWLKMESLKKMRQELVGCSDITKFIPSEETKNALKEAYSYERYPEQETTKFKDEFLDSQFKIKQ